MIRQRVSSSNVANVGYDSQSLTLEVGFHFGGVYQYYRVPISEYRRLVGAASIGSYLHNHIKGVYSYRRVA